MKIYSLALACVAIVNLIRATDEEEGLNGVIQKGLPFSFSSYEPFVDEETMQLHWGGHHRAYTDNTNVALRYLYGNPEIPDYVRQLAKESLNNDLDSLAQLISIAEAEEALAPASAKKSLRSIRNNGGGFINHNEYFDNLAPARQGGGADPVGSLAEALDQKFGSINSFREKFNEAAMNVFGSGWAWLILTSKGELEIITTPNQDRPPVSSSVILGCDLWEHAYYLKHRNRRPSYLNSFWSVANFKEAQRRYETAKEACMNFNKE